MEVIPMWACSKCGEQVGDDFEVCWSCGTSKDGVEDPTFRRADDPEETAGAGDPSLAPPDSIRGTDETQAASGRPDRKSFLGRGGANPLVPCRGCGSFKIIPDVQVLDQSDSGDGDLRLLVCGNLDAMIFKDRVYGVIRARVC